MQQFEQGSVLRIEGIRFPALVVSNHVFNEEGCAIICPIVPQAEPGPLHIPFSDTGEVVLNGFVLCEQVKFVDLRAKRFTVITNSKYFDIMDITDAITAIFEYL